MNYIKEINAFYNSLEYTPLSNAAVLLWHALMQVNNRAGWVKEFSAASRVLTTKAQLKDTAFKTARKELEEKGYILVQNRSGNQAAMYQMISLTKFVVQSIEENEVNQEDHTIEEKSNCPSADKNDHNSDPLIKQEETKGKEIQNLNSSMDVCCFYNENFGKLPSHLQNEITEWVSMLGETLVMEAMKIAIETNSLKWSYVKGILKKWSAKGISTIEQVRESEQTFRLQQQSRYRSNPSQKKQEVIPDWFLERKESEKSKEKVILVEDKPDVEILLADFSRNKKIDRSINAAT
ncbi:DnaD domain-containing protein [Aquibacillus rhizosphaerae]|uniref:DnaD domain protein n=1 Tax=Aquibacillus rhizosphaerae TaxID=3051431 RepID=A0ABT7L798_9BACI|nr:DnaD domain protein [Aquibacillus sp. LR5S19]MDL4841734.1 DnaD domain protein [Aquibacillus sp. LR5S19]